MKRTTDAPPQDDEASKRARVESVPTTAPGKPSLSLGALEKAKKALQLQKELKEKLKKLPQVGLMRQREGRGLGGTTQAY